MAITHTITKSYKSGAGTVSGIGALAMTGDTELNVERAIPAGSTDYEINIDLVAANIQSLMIHSDQACTIETNSGSSPANTITLAARTAIDWATGYSYACPITANVTSIFVTVPGASAAEFKFYCLLDNGA